MYTLIIMLLIIVAILICGIVLIQESKGGGLASGFSSANATLGVRKTTDFLEKTTWTLAAVLIVLSVLSSKFVGSDKKDQNLNMAAPVAPAPAQQSPLNVGGEQAAPAAGEQTAPAPATPAKGEQAAPAPAKPAEGEQAAPAPATPQADKAPAAPATEANAPAVPQGDAATTPAKTE